MSLDHLIHTEPTWGLAVPGTGPASVGPLPAFGGYIPELTVTAIPASSVPAGAPEQQPIEVVESAARFQAVPHRFDGEAIEGLWHPAGENWILWNSDFSSFFVSSSPSWPQTWVHVRFVLRHFAVSRLLRRAGHGRAHAVAATLQGSDDHAVLIAGRSGAGKTRLMNRLLARGSLTHCIEDDCAVVGPGWEITSLLPAERELVTARRAVVKAVVWLHAAAGTVTEASAIEGGGVFTAFPASWPVAWLPEGGYEAKVPDVEEIPCLRVPERADDNETVLRSVEDLLAAVNGRR